MSVLDAIGNTPLIEIKRLNLNPKVKVLAKFEGANPGGSVKDRPAYYMIKEAERTKELTKDKIIVESTSGNTGIALAMIGSAKGYKVKLFMPECVSQERQRTIEAFGAEVVLTPAKEGTDGAIRRGREQVEQDPKKYYHPDQFSNDANVLSHYETTGPEIFKQTKGKVDHFVAGMGTTGTLMGTGRYLKEKNKDIRILAVEPEQGHKIQGLKNMTESMVPKIYKPKEMDEIITVKDDEAFDTARRLAGHEGIFVGISSGAAVAIALKVAKTLKSGNVVALMPDRGDRYLSTTLFRAVCAKCPP